MAKKRRIWPNPNFPFPMSFPKRMLLAISAILIPANLVIFYLHRQLPLSFVLLVSVLEIVVIAINFAFWVPSYKLKW